MIVKLVLVLCACSQLNAQTGRLIWEDNFDFFDPGKWEMEASTWGGGNGEFQVYLPDDDHIFTEDGSLHLLPTLLESSFNPLTGMPFGPDFLWNGRLDMFEMYGYCTDERWMEEMPWACVRDSSDDGMVNPVASGRVRTKDRFHFVFGRVEIRAKLPAGDWLWPAIWLMPEFEDFGGWPRSGEVDIAESIGNADLHQESTGASVGRDKMMSTIHFGPQWDDNGWHLAHTPKWNTTNNYADFFHDYVWEWTPNGMSWTIDGDTIMRVPEPPIDQNPGWEGFWYFNDNGNGWWSTDQNPWEGQSLMAPFDRDFHFILCTAIGATNGFIPDDVTDSQGNYYKPWSNNDQGTDAMFNFYNNGVESWLPTWQGNNAAMQVDYIRVYEL